AQFSLPIVDTERIAKRKKDRVTYRIPALIYISDNRILLAFAEKWKTADDTDIWNHLALHHLLINGSSAWDSSHELLTSACLPNHRSMNPCPVYERESKTLFLFFICDTGKTWIVPTYVYPCNSLNFKPTSRKGSTWHLGKCVDGESNECQMAEIIDDKGNSKLYFEALSESNGEAFDKPSSAHKLTEIGHATEKTWLLYCHPTNPRKRACLGVYLNKSPWDASGWEDHKLIIYDGPNGYSDLAQCGDGKQFACLMECGEISEVFKLSDII
uniref:Exo-alpha-sialidase n=1 Tax=Cyprinus carpio carpio TaxID=630221 RepID=A0A8C0Y9W3_CYPCA